MKAIVCLVAGYPFDLDQNRAMQKMCLSRRRFLRLRLMQVNSIHTEIISMS